MLEAQFEAVLLNSNWLYPLLRLYLHIWCHIRLQAWLNYNWCCSFLVSAAYLEKPTAAIMVNI